MRSPTSQFSETTLLIILKLWRQRVLQRAPPWICAATVSESVFSFGSTVIHITLVISVISVIHQNMILEGSFLTSCDPSLILHLPLLYPPGLLLVLLQLHVLVLVELDRLLVQLVHIVHDG